MSERKVCKVCGGTVKLQGHARADRMQWVCHGCGCIVDEDDSMETTKCGVCGSEDVYADEEVLGVWRLYCADCDATGPRVSPVEHPEDGWIGA